MKKLFIPFAFIATFGLFAFANSADSNTPVTQFMEKATTAKANVVSYSNTSKTVLTKDCWYIHCVPPTKQIQEEVENIIAKY